jgi:hypothetical protein
MTAYSRKRAQPFETQGEQAALLRPYRNISCGLRNISYLKLLAIWAVIPGSGGVARYVEGANREIHPA